MSGRAYVSGQADARHGASHTAPLLWRITHAALQLVLPVLLLMALSAAAFLYGDRPAGWFGPVHEGSWLTLGHLMLPLTFFCIGLTNRRYGAGAALAQTLLAWGLGAALVWLDGAELAGLSGRALPDMGTMLGFGGGLLAGQLFSLAVFDLTRGPRWWMAPLLSWLTGTLLFAVIAIPVTYAGASWSGDLGLYAGLLAASSVAMLLPYWLLRPLVPPLSGFGGY